MIDKANGNVGFRSDTHEYFDLHDSGKKYISVTTLIHRYVNPFDKEFWSAYKAMERLVPKESWVIEKKYLLSRHRFDKEMLVPYGIGEKEFEAVRQGILDEWDRKNRESCERGTRIHAEIEGSFYGNPHGISLQKFGIGGRFECRRDYSKLDLENGVYPEYLIYRESEDGILRIAGQIDLVVKSGNDITVADWKTNAKIDMKAGYDTRTGTQAMMRYPLNNLPDCNFYHYSLQLSTYAWMLKKMNPSFNIKDLLINHYDHDGGETLYHCDYLEKEVERMLRHYKRGLVLEGKRARREKIEY